MEKTEDDINKLIDEGFNTIEKLVPETGVTAGCGACRFKIQSMIDEYQRNKVSLPNDAGT
jgi:bacterioferritin-associated ferredoxin